jgi:signal transduction histidine kinase/CheY-like chemotaxis protein
VNRQPTPERLARDNALLLEEVKVARRASEITAELVVEQFVKMDEVNSLLQQKADSERALQLQLRQELREAELREREIEEARRAADAANRTKSTFLANMSHELRTPLNAIIGYSELVQEELEDRQIQDLTPDLQKISAAGKHLLALINDILDLSKIEAGKFELLLESFEIDTAIDEVVATIEPLLRANGNTLDVRRAEGLGEMRADLVRVRQCLFNLLSNACKFTERGRITLEVAREREGDRDTVLMRVSDSGIGMTEEQMTSLFQPFMQVDASSTRKYGGTGLGLSITKRYCELMGGGIQVESALGKGTSFTIRLPADIGVPAWKPEPQPEPAAAEAATEQAVTVLAIDDEPGVREWMRRSLAGPGLRVVTAREGREGLKLARELRPAVIILDVVMPGMDGWAVLGELKADAELAQIPVIVATILDDRDMGFALGASNFVTKPLERDKLLEMVEAYCGGKRNLPILVVDDDPAARETVRRTLRKEQWGVVEAENGKAALERLAECQPALVLLDLLMPEMDGFEVLERMHENEAWRAIPVVVITAKSLTAADRERLDRCVERVIQKGSFSRADLLREVNRVVGKRSVEAPG